MLHAREDYNRIQDPDEKIAEDEPVFLLRAHDQCFAETVRFWAALHELKGGERTISNMARDHSIVGEHWQLDNGKKRADL